MALSIRNDKAEQLAREVAGITGENITQAIIHALEERLHRILGKRRVRNLAAEILTISKRCSALPDLDERSPDEILDYNQIGAIG